MNELERQSPFSKDILDERYYFASFFQNAMLHGLISDDTAERLQAESAELLSRQIMRYTDGKSSSVRTETAQELSDSVWYSISVALKPKSVADAAELLNRSPLAHIFVAGQKSIARKVSVCRLSHASLVRNLFPTGNEFYASTIRDGILGFFKLYRPEFFAHRTIITADYPSMCGEGDVCGIEFIERYVRNLFYENAFLKHFSPEKAHSFLLLHNPGYEKAPVNICEPILCAALLCVLCDRDPFSLTLCREDFETLYALLAEKSPDELHFYFAHAAARLFALLSCDDALSRYMTKAVGLLLPAFENAVRFHTLEKFGYK